MIQQNVKQMDLSKLNPKVKREKLSVELKTTGFFRRDAEFIE